FPIRPSSRAEVTASSESRRVARAVLSVDDWAAAVRAEMPGTSSTTARQLPLHHQHRIRLLSLPQEDVAFLPDIGGGEAACHVGLCDIVDREALPLDAAPALTLR